MGRIMYFEMPQIVSHLLFLQTRGCSEVPVLTSLPTPPSYPCDDSHDMICSEPEVSTLQIELCVYKPVLEPQGMTSLFKILLCLIDKLLKICMWIVIKTKVTMRQQSS